MSTAATTTVSGAFSDYASAKAAISELRAKGYDDSQLGVIAKDSDGEFADLTEATNVDEGATAGVAGGLLGGTLWGLGIAAGLLPAIGPVIAGGTLAAIAASGATAAAAGGIVGALVGLGIPDNEAAYYAKQFEDGHAVVTVETKSEQDAAEAKQILLDAGAVQFAGN